MSKHGQYKLEKIETDIYQIVQWEQSTDKCYLKKRMKK